jgi:CRISPR-associated protein Csa2
MVYVGISARIVVNVGALNMAESVGNVVRHKKAPVVVPLGEEGFTLRYVPVISGQNIAHGYQEILADLASKRGLPVCPLCKNGVFLKHSSTDIFDDLKKLGAKYVDELRKIISSKSTDVVDKMHLVEKEIIANCVVEDVGGFLLTDVPVKRTSRFYSGYAIPSLSYLSAAATEAQFHIRHDIRPERGRQAIYYVETSSALYALNVALDIDGIGCTSAVKKEALDNRDLRLEVALEALAYLISGPGFGAKRSRFLPHWEVESLVVTVSHPLSFNPVPAHDDNYIVRTVKFASKLEEETRLFLGENSYVKVFYYKSEGSPVKEPERGAERAETPLDAVLLSKKFLKDSKCS